MKIAENYNLKVISPEVARQWHPTKNGNIKPDQVTPGSPRKVWWLCNNGHEWQAGISRRNHGNGCPYCASKEASKEYNLSAVHPEIAKQWHTTKNEDLTPDQVMPHSDKKVWWKCDKNHEWRTEIRIRSRGNGYPYCAGKSKRRNKPGPDLSGKFQIPNFHSPQQ